MEKKNLVFTQVLDLMQPDEFAIIVQKGELKTAPSGKEYISPPSALYWDRKDDYILKSTGNNLPVDVCWNYNKNAEPTLYDIVDADGFVKYLMSHMGAKEKGVEE